MEDLFDFYNPLNNNSPVAYILLAIIIFSLLFLPDKLKIYSTRGVAVTTFVLTLIVLSHQISFIRELIPYY